jgi:hypothetical protein
MTADVIDLRTASEERRTASVPEAAAPAQPDRRSGDRSRLYRYEMRVRTVLSQAILATMPVRTSSVSYPKHSVRGLRVGGAAGIDDVDIADVVARLNRAGAQVLEISVRRRRR